MIKKSSAPESKLEFTVEQGKTIYLGRFDANRFLEISSIWNNFVEDIQYLKNVAVLKAEEIENRSMDFKGWWLPHASGKDVLKTLGKTESDCEQCAPSSK